MFKQANKRQILRDVYEENLWVVGKKGSRRSAAHSKPSKDKKFQGLPFLITIGVVVVTSVVAAWHGPLMQPFENATVVTAQQHSGAGYADAQTGVNEGEAIVESIIPTPQLPDQSVEVKTNGAGLVISGSPAYLPGLLFEHGDLEDLDAFELHDAKLTPENFQSLATTDIPLAQLFGLRVKTIVIDPGHGGRDPGAVGDNIYEKDIALDIAKRLRDRLLEYDYYRVLMTRETDETVSLNRRVNFANANDADLFISIHVNNFPTDQKSFVETYYFGPTEDTKIIELAARENANSHYPYAEFKEIIQKIGDTLKFQESKQLAYAVQRNLFDQLSKIDKRTGDHGIKAAPFVVLLGLDSPSILSEVSCLCNREEEQRLNTATYREDIASFLEKGIVTYLNKNTRVGGNRNGEKEKLAKAQQ